MSDYILQIDATKLGEVLQELADDTGGFCLETSVFIGTVDGKPVKLSVIDRDEAEESHDYNDGETRFNCVSSAAKP